MGAQNDDMDPELAKAPRIERMLWMVSDFRDSDTGEKLSYTEFKERIARTDYRRNRGTERW